MFRSIEKAIDTRHRDMRTVPVQLREKLRGETQRALREWIRIKGSEMSERIGSEDRSENRRDGAAPPPKPTPTPPHSIPSISEPNMPTY